MRTRLGRLEGLRRSRRAIQRVETIHLKHEAVRTANDKPKHGNHAANVHITAAARLGISTAAPKLGRGKRSHPPKMSKPPVSASPQRGPTFPSSPPHKHSILQTTTPPSSCSSHQPIPVICPVSDLSMSIISIQPCRHRDPHAGSLVAKSLRAEPRPIVCRPSARRRCPGLGGETAHSSDHEKKPQCRIQGVQGVCLANR